MSTATTSPCRFTARWAGRRVVRGTGDMRVLSCRARIYPRLARRLLRHLIRYTLQSVLHDHNTLDRSHFWAVAPAEQSGSWTGATMSEWLSTAVTLVAGAISPCNVTTPHNICAQDPTSTANFFGGPLLSHIWHIGGGVRNSDVVLGYIDPNVTPCCYAAWFFFGDIAPLHDHFQVQQDSGVAMALPAPSS